MITIDSKALEDLINIYRAELLEVGYDTSIITDDHQLLITYYTIKKRLIPQCSRQVHYANNFVCPFQLQNGLDLLKDKFERGIDVRPHLSKTIERIDKEDKLLYSWNIHHFHLGEAVTSDGFIQRTGDVLFAIFTPNDVYFLCIMRHDNWSNIELVQIIHDNWPQLISNFKVEGEFAIKFDSQDIKELRKAGLNVGITMRDGTSYLPMGMGFALTGQSAQAVMDSNHEFHRIKRLEQDIQNESETLFEHCSSQLMNRFRQNGIELRIHQAIHALVAYDSKTGQNIAVVPHYTLQEENI